MKKAWLMTNNQAVISKKRFSFDAIAVAAAIDLDGKLLHFVTAPMSIRKDQMIKLLDAFR